MRTADEGLGRLSRSSEPDLGVLDEIPPFVVRQHDDRAGLRDGELLARDLLARVAEDVGVLEADVREQDDGGIDDVRRVEPAAESRFHDGGIDASLREVRERGGRQRLELRGVRRFGRAADLCDRALERVGIGVEALVPAAHVR